MSEVTLQHVTSKAWKAPCGKTTNESVGRLLLIILADGRRVIAFDPTSSLTEVENWQSIPVIALFSQAVCSEGGVPPSWAEMVFSAIEQTSVN